MSKYSKFNIVCRLQKWMDSVAGQTFLNYAYSWGASVVILGTLFKLTHLPGANLLLFIGMGTEVFVFFISAFDRPFDKTTDGMELQRSSQNNSEEEIVSVEVEDVHQESERNTILHDRYNMSTILTQTQQQLRRAEELSERLPDNAETAELKKTLTAIHEVYKLQLTKASSQMTTIDEIDRQLKTMSENLEELNRVYTRMIAAVKQ